MLRSLDIRDMLIIDRLELAFQPGLNVLTGETGAGKSILLDSLGFVLGWRGRAELVRQGAAQGEVEAVFHLPPHHAAHDILKDAGLPDEESELILRRVNSRDGRKTAWINGRRASGDVLRRVSETLIELHGQHDDRGLLDVSGHRALLDSFGGMQPLLAETAQTWKAHSAAKRALAQAEKALEAVKAEEDYLRHAYVELEAIAPEVGEEAQLDTRRRQMQGAEKIRDDVMRAAQALGISGAEGAMGDALRWLEGAASSADGNLEAALESLGRAQVELGDALSEVERCLDHLAFDPRELEDTEERLFALRGLARKHGVSVDELVPLMEDLMGKLDRLDASVSNMDRLNKAVDDTGKAYRAAATQLTQARIHAAERLDKAMAQELAPLKMERAVFRTNVSPCGDGPEGSDLVAFEVATNPGAPSGPLNKIASGGELSRFLLALKVCLAGNDKSITMIFDEIDRGVGGATADAVGRRLKVLAEGGQVLVVTHSPQVAALGAHHWRVSKRVENDVTLSRVSPLDEAQRVDEIARMISGDHISQAAKAAAEELIAGA